MPLDPNIALQVKSLELPNQLAQYGQIAAIQHAQNQNALAQLQMREAEASAQERNALRGLNPGAADYEQQLFRVSPQLGIQYRKEQAATEASKAQKAKAEQETAGMTFDLRIKKANKAVADISALNSPAEAIASIDQHLAAGDIDQQKADMLKGQLQAAPSFAAWQKSMVTGILDAKDRVINERELERIGLEKQRVGYEGQRVNLEGQRVGLEKQRVGLEGRRVSLAEQAQGTEGLAPKEIQKREAALPQATAVIKGFESKSDSFVKDLKALRDHPGLSQITGVVAGRVPALTAEGRAAQALYDKVVAKGGFQALQDLRDASKTGGALGNVSNQEGKQLTASFAAIDRRQDAPDVRAALDRAIGDVEGAKTRMREAYDSTYSYKTNKKAPAAGGDTWKDL